MPGLRPTTEGAASTEATVRPPGPLLSITDLGVRFGGLKAVDGVSLELGRGELLGLIGPNGAGKTTTIVAVTGFVAATGSICFDGEEVRRLAPHRRARLGLARTWQSLELFDDLSVLENCVVGAAPPPLGQALGELVVPRDVHQVRAAEDALAELDLAHLADRSPSELSLGQRKLVAVARALAGGPKAVLLDEPAAGLDSQESLDLGRQLRAVVSRGLSLLLVDHDMGLVLGVCDRVAVLEFGRIIACGTPAEIRDDPRVLEAYLGAQAPAGGTP